MPMPDHNRGRNHNNSYSSFPSSSAVDNSSSPPPHSTPTTTQPDPQQQPQQRTAPSSLSSLQHGSNTATYNNTNDNIIDRKKSKNNTNTPPIGRDQSPSSFRSSGSSLSCSSLLLGVNYNNSSTSGPLAKDQPWQSKVKAASTVVGQFVSRKIPIVSWLVSSPGYNWKNDLTQDLFAGVTISAVIIPQSMAYAMLASLPAVHGLYTSLVPTALYAVLGTSKHMSTGTFAITSLLLGQFAHKVLSDQGFVDDLLPDGEYQRRYLPTCLMLTAVVGGVQILLSMARLGRWTSRHLLPTALVSGFNTASAFHIGTHQLRHWLGMRPPQEGGVFGMIRIWIWIVQHFWQDTVWPSLAMGLGAMIFMYILQRIEYWRRRSNTDLVPLYSSSPAPSVTLASPSLPGHPSVFSYSASNSGSPYSQQACRPSSNGSTQSTDRPNSQRLPRATSNTRLPGQRRASVIVPRAVSDQALLTAQDVALQAPCLDYDSCSPGCSPNFGPNPHEDQPALPNLKLPTPFLPPNSRPGADGTRPVLIMPSRSTSPQLHSPTSPRVAGLTNTGAVGHRHDRGSRSHKPSPKVRRYKTFRSTTLSPLTSRGSQHHPQPHLQHHQHQQQQQKKQRGSMDLLNDECEPLLSVNSGGNGAGTASEAEEGYASSSASSTCYARTRRYYPERPQELQRIESTQQPYWRICIPQVHLPIPDIFICVVVFTCATVIFNLDTEYGIEVIGMIPTGLPMMAWPGAYIDAWSIQDWVPLLWPGILMAMVVYVMSLSVAKHFGREYGYEIDADQEMLALGVSSLVGSCFGGYACTGSLTRSAILAQLGAKTPLASLVGAFMVLMSLLWFTVLFERIPNTILAAIVLVALKSLFAHTVEVKRLWRVGRRKEALIWWTTFISVIVFSIEIGLAVGISLVVVLKLYKHGKKWKRVAGRYIRHSATYQRIMLMLGLHSPLFTTAGRGLYTNDDEDDY